VVLGLIHPVIGLIAFLVASASRLLNGWLLNLHLSNVFLWSFLKLIFFVLVEECVNSCLIGYAVRRTSLPLLVDRFGSELVPCQVGISIVVSLVVGAAVSLFGVGI